MTVEEMPQAGRREFPDGLVVRQWVPNVLIAFAFFCLLVWAFSPVLTSNYGYNDDYEWITRAAEGFRFNQLDALSTGRPLTGWGNDLVFSTVNSINDLKKARCISVGGIVFFALTAFAVFRKSGFDEVFSAMASLLMSLTPSFAIYAGWLTTGLDSYAAAFALLAGHFICVGVEQRRRRALHIFFAVILLLIAYASYQPVAAFAVIAMLARTWRNFQVHRATLRNFALQLGVFMAATALYYLIFKVYVAIYHVGGEADRATLTSDVLDKLRFFVRDLMWWALTGWYRLHSTLAQCVSAIIVGGVIVAGCLAKPRKKLTLQLAGLGCVLVTMVLATLPLLVVRADQLDFRTESALQSAAAFAFLLGLERLLQSVNFFGLAKWRVVGFGALVFLSAGMTRHDISHKFIRLNKREVSNLRRGIAGTKEFPERLIYIVPSQITLPGDDIGEYGDKTAALTWVAPSMIELLYIEALEPHVPLREALKRHENFRVEYGPCPVKKPFPVLDGFALVDGESKVVQDPYWGTIRTNQNGWCCSDWFGVFDNRRFPMIYHSQLGWMYCGDKSGDDFWFGMQRYDWVRTGPNLYPKMFFKGRGSWFVIDPTISLITSFYDLDRKEWTFTPQAKIPPGSAEKK